MLGYIRFKLAFGIALIAAGTVVSSVCPASTAPDAAVKNRNELSRCVAATADCKRQSVRLALNTFPADQTGSTQQDDAQQDDAQQDSPSDPYPVSEIATLGQVKEGQIVLTPRILTVRYGELRARYIDPALGGEDAKQALATLAKHLAPLIRELMASGEGNLVLDSPAVIAGARDADLTGRLIAKLDTVYSPLNPQRPVLVQTEAKPSATAPLALVADIKLLRSNTLAQADPPRQEAIANVLDSLMQSHRASLILDRDAVVLGTIDIDVTKSAIASLTGKGNRVKQYAAPAAARIAVLDRNAILLKSHVGNFIVDRVHALTAAAESEFKPRGDQLRTEGDELLQRSNRTDSEVADYNARQEAFQQEVKERESEIENGVTAARRRIENALAPLLQRLMREHGANLLIDRNAVLDGSIDLDISAETIGLLDRVMPTTPVERVKDSSPQ